MTDSKESSFSIRIIPKSTWFSLPSGVSPTMTVLQTSEIEQRERLITTESTTSVKTETAVVSLGIDNLGFAQRRYWFATRQLPNEQTIDGLPLQTLGRARQSSMPLTTVV